ncbi:putative membrane protein insertion efficiency factor isoform X2 [Benincasa hispida]|uniref:putative membrane protein insertion efficiency factor isoform X2 n=1 Tax=Benincasa hispida TaxID=102211 RepID=UPI0019018EAA|nr:putative membrane protein insertion efficiency factor isoform X2 [Benincasa hispida]
MAVLSTTNCHKLQNQNPSFFAGRCHQRPFSAADFSIQYNRRNLRRPLILSKTRATSNSSSNSDQGEISPLLPNSCRYLPTCSEYSMQAYKKYGVAKGTILTAWRLCRCNPLGNDIALLQRELARRVDLGLILLGGLMKKACPNQKIDNFKCCI